MVTVAVLQQKLWLKRKGKRKTQVKENIIIFSVGET